MAFFVCRLVWCQDRVSMDVFYGIKKQDTAHHIKIQGTTTKQKKRTKGFYKKNIFISEQYINTFEVQCLLCTQWQKYKYIALPIPIYISLSRQEVSSCSEYTADLNNLNIYRFVCVTVPNCCTHEVEGMGPAFCNSAFFKAPSGLIYEGCQKCSTPN